MAKEKDSKSCQYLMKKLFLILCKKKMFPLKIESGDVHSLEAPMLKIVDSYYPVIRIIQSSLYLESPVHMYVYTAIYSVYIKFCYILHYL